MVTTVLNATKPWLHPKRLSLPPFPPCGAWARTDGSATLSQWIEVQCRAGTGPRLESATSEAEDEGVPMGEPVSVGVVRVGVQVVSGETVAAGLLGDAEGDGRAEPVGAGEGLNDVTVQAIIESAIIGTEATLKKDRRLLGLTPRST
jgi:hypothetical protein